MLPLDAQGCTAYGGWRPLPQEPLAAAAPPESAALAKVAAGLLCGRTAAASEEDIEDVAARLYGRRAAGALAKAAGGRGHAAEAVPCRSIFGGAFKMLRAVPRGAK
jgi:hypothetical protein